MSILSDAFDGVVDFLGGLGGDSAPGTYAPGASSPGPYAPSYQSDNLPSFDSVSRIVGPLLQIGGPLIKATVAKPNTPKFPEVPDSVKNDPRVQNLLGSYGFTDGTMPSIKQQSAFQAAFPAMYNTAVDLFSPTPAPAVQAQAQSQRVLNNSAGITQAPASTPTQVATTVLANDPALMYQSKPATYKDTQLINSTSKYDDLITDSAKQNGIDPNLVRAIIQHESGGNPDAVGDDGLAIGLGQMHAAAAQDAHGGPITEAQLKDPTIAIPLIAKHLASLNKQFGGNEGDPSYEKTITAYNAGKKGSSNSKVYNSQQVAQYRGTVSRLYGLNQKFYQS